MSPYSARFAANPEIWTWQAWRKELLRSSSLQLADLLPVKFPASAGSLCNSAHCPLYFYPSSEALPLFFPMSRPLQGFPVLIGWLEEVSTWPPAGALETAAAKKRGGNELIFSSPGPWKQQKHRTDQTYWKAASFSLITKRQSQPYCYLEEGKKKQKNNHAVNLGLAVVSAACLSLGSHF